MQRLFYVTNVCFEGKENIKKEIAWIQIGNEFSPVIRTLMKKYHLSRKPYF